MTRIPELLDRAGLELEFEDAFDGPRLDVRRWIPEYLPQWSTPDRTAARYEILDGQLRLLIEAGQPPWCPELDGGLRVSSIQTGVFSGPIGSASRCVPRQPSSGPHPASVNASIVGSPGSPLSPGSPGWSESPPKPNTMPASSQERSLSRVLRPSRPVRDPAGQIRVPSSASAAIRPSPTTSATPGDQLRLVLPLLDEAQRASGRHRAARERDHHQRDPESGLRLPGHHVAPAGDGRCPDTCRNLRWLPAERGIAAKNLASRTVDGDPRGEAHCRVDGRAGDNCGRRGSADQAMPQRPRPAGPVGRWRRSAGPAGPARRRARMSSSRRRRTAGRVR